MKFKFCGDQDCPDWLLAEIAVLSRLSSVRTKLVGKQVIGSLLGEKISHDKLYKYTSSHRITFSEEDVKAILATLSFIFSNASKYDIDGEILYPELEQLGLPSDVARSITKTYLASRDHLVSVFKLLTFRLPTITETKWRVNYIVASSNGDHETVEARIALTTPNNGVHGGNTVSFEASSLKLQMLLSELKAAHAILEQIDQ